MVESKLSGTSVSFKKQDGNRGHLVDRGVGSPRLVKTPSTTAFDADLNLDSETKVFVLFNYHMILNSFCLGYELSYILYLQNSMPAAAGAVAAAAVADQMLGPKEHKHLAIVLVVCLFRILSKITDKKRIGDKGKKRRNHPKILDF